jgi:hypothetical protein
MKSDELGLLLIMRVLYALLALILFPRLYFLKMGMLSLANLTISLADEVRRWVEVLSALNLRCNLVFLAI